ncbi:MAG: hypothetical protein ABJN84_17810 [Flavobacteriaceae bacterium]
MAVFFVCTSQNILFSQNCNKKYKVVKIDSTEGNYLVHIKKAKKTFLLISSKEDVRIADKIGLGNKIEVGQRYRLKLLEYGVRFASIPPEMEQTLSIDGREVWKKGDDFDVFVSKNLAGLYYIRHPKD